MSARRRDHSPATRGAVTRARESTRRATRADPPAAVLVAVSAVAVSQARAELSGAGGGGRGDVSVPHPLANFIIFSNMHETASDTPDTRVSLDFPGELC